MIEKNDYLTATRDDINALFPTLEKRVNKGDMGRVLCVCGSYDPCGSAMCGAAYFSAAAAYKCGAGIVEIFTHRKNYEALASLLPEAVYSLYDTEKETADAVCARLTAQICKADSIVLGCGLGKSEIAKNLVKTTLENANCPVVIDADGLNILSEHQELGELVKNRKADTVLTPHPGEMRRLSGLSIPDILNDTVNTAASLSHRLGSVTLLKDHNTVITDGKLVFINQSGNAGMASAGMGDILTGIIGALLSRTTVAEWADEDRTGIPSALYRTATAAYIHGLAGDIAAGETGEYSLTASDVIGSISKAIKPLK